MRIWSSEFWNEMSRSYLYLEEEWIEWYRFLNKMSWDGLVELVSDGGKQGAHDLATLLSSDAWLDTAVNWLHDTNVPVFVSKIDGDYERLLTRTFADHLESCSFPFKMQHMEFFLSKLGPSQAYFFLHNEANQAALLQLACNEGWQRLHHLFPDHVSSKPSQPSQDSLDAFSTQQQHTGSGWIKFLMTPFSRIGQRLAQVVAPFFASLPSEDSSVKDPEGFFQVD